MRQVSVAISTYTSDVSGVCSALYELGGMVVIHDPSGCNSTYNTHDEPRWFDQDSLIFISGLSQMDAVMGDDDKFIEDILRAAEELKPRFIALVRSPIPLMIGTDFDGIATEIEARCGIPTFFVPTTGMRSYVKGAGMAFETMVRRFMPGPGKIGEKGLEERQSVTFSKRNLSITVKKGLMKDTTEDMRFEVEPWKVNILGATPLDFSIDGTYEDLKTYLTEAGFVIQGSLAYQTSFEEMLTMPEADVNLVVTACGYEAAKAMEEIYGIPYVIGFPTGVMAPLVTEALKEAANEKKNINLLVQDIGQKNQDKIQDNIQDNVQNCCYDNMQKKGVLIHEPVIAASLAKVLSISKEQEIQPVSMVETEDIFLESGVKHIVSEEVMQDYLKDAAFIMADPMFRPICPAEIPFCPLVHEAFSGRTYRKEIRNLIHYL